MKNKFTLSVIVVGVAFFALGWAAADQHAKLHSKTMENLSTAMHGEAFAYAKYEMFADQARKDGNTEVADLFDKTAKVEQLEHFREHAELAAIVGSDQANLKDAIKGESYETETMYPTFAKQARAAGDQDAANRFAEIGKDEAGHRDAFRAELSKLEAKHASGN
jgi:rubrerythrin